VRESVDLSSRFLTGENGSGKTTVLNILNRHFGWSFRFLGTPRRDRTGILRYLIDDRRGIRAKVAEAGGQATIGSLEYRNGTTTPILVPADIGDAYDANFPHIQTTNGIFIPSHRPVYVYQPVPSIPTVLRPADELLATYVNEFRNRFQPGTQMQSASFRLKEALISLATFGYGSPVMARNEEALALYQGFVDKLHTTLPPTLGFNELFIEPPEVILRTATGDFPFDAVSGGASAIIDLTWQIYMASSVFEDFVVLIDEPENHLHPELQRTLFPGFIEAFPGAQFITATHNPFIVSSVADSSVYVLRYNDRERVEASLLGDLNKAGSSNDILRDALGLTFTMPLWVENTLTNITARYSEQEVSAESLRALKAEMVELGLGDVYPEAVERILEPSDDQT
jgi:hypothetical protein